MKKASVRRTLAGFFLSLVATTSNAAVLTFQEIDFVQPQFELQGIGNDIFTKGFRLSYAPAAGEPYPVGFAAVGPKWAYNSKSMAVATNSCSGSATLTSQDNNPFDVASIDLASLNGDPSYAVRFFGVKADGGTVEYEIVIDGAPSWKRHTFPSNFTRLQSLIWLQGDCIANKPHMFDNIFVERSR